MWAKENKNKGKMKEMTRRYGGHCERKKKPSKASSSSSSHRSWKSLGFFIWKFGSATSLSFSFSFSFFCVELKIKLYRLAKLDPQPQSKEYTVRLKIFWANISGHNSGPEVQRKLAQIVNLEWDLDFFYFFIWEVGLIVYMILSNNILLQRYHCILHDSGLDSIPLGSH